MTDNVTGNDPAEVTGNAAPDTAVSAGLAADAEHAADMKGIALSLAIQHHHARPHVSPSDIVDAAEKFWQWLKREL